MEFMEREIEVKDEVTLQRGQSRVTIAVSDYVHIEETKEQVGLVDQWGAWWMLNGPVPEANWVIVGLVKAEKPEPVKLPTREGWYVVAPADDEPYTLYLDSANQWQATNAGTVFIIDPSSLIAEQISPLYEPDEHFTEVSSDGHTIYNLVKQYGEDGEPAKLSCECKGFEFRGKCKHVDKWQFLLEFNANA